MLSSFMYQEFLVLHHETQVGIFFVIILSNRFDLSLPSFTRRGIHLTHLPTPQIPIAAPFGPTVSRIVQFFVFFQYMIDA